MKLDFPTNPGIRDTSAAYCETVSETAFDEKPSWFAFLKRIFSRSVPTPAPLEEGDAVVSATIRPGEPAVLQWEGATLMIPAESLPKNLEVKLSSVPAERTDLKDRFPNEIPLTEVYKITFSDALRARQPIMLKVKIPLPVETGFYGRLKVEEGPTYGEHTGSTDWSLEIGRYDSENRALFVPFFTTAKKSRSWWSPNGSRTGQTNYI